MLGERRGIYDRFRVFVGVDYGGLVGLRYVLPEADQRCVLILGNVIVEIDECRDLLGSGAVRIHNHTAPQVSGLKSEQVEACNNAKVVRSAFKSLEQVGIRVFVGVDDASITEDDLSTLSAPCPSFSAGSKGRNLEVGNVVTDKPVASSEE